MIDRGKITIDIAAKNVRVSIAIVFVSPYRPVGALVAPVGEAVTDKPLFENRADHRAQRVMHDAVAERRCGDEPLFRVVDLDDSITAGPITAVAKLAFKGQQFALKICEEGGGGRLFALAFYSAPRGVVQGPEIGDAVK